MTAVFAILAAVTIAGAAAAMALRNLIHSVLALVLAFAGLAGIYLALGAQFVGFAQVLVYIGAVAILAVFAILLTRTPETASGGMFSQPAPRPSCTAGAAIAAAVFTLLAWAVERSAAFPQAAMPPASAISVQQIGAALVGRFVLPLEVLGLLLTAALVGAVVVALHERRP